MSGWIAWILASALFLALYDLAKKASVRENAVLPVLLCSTLCGSAAFLLGLFASGQLASAWNGLNVRVVLLASSKAVIVASSWVFTFHALRSLPITVATPIRASSPALVFLAAFFLYGECPSLLQAFGMILVFAGYWAFSWAGRHEGIDFLRNRAVWCAIAGACLSAVSGLWDKYVFQVAAAPVESIQLLFQVGLVIAYALLLGTGRLIGSSSPEFHWRWTITFVGILLAAADWLYFRGMAIPGTPVSVASLMRRFSIVITFVLGALFFRERNLMRKTVALSLVLTGIALLCLCE